MLRLFVILRPGCNQHFHKWKSAPISQLHACLQKDCSEQSGPAGSTVNYSGGMHYLMSIVVSMKISPGVKSGGVERDSLQMHLRPSKLGSYVVIIAKVPGSDH